MANYLPDHPAAQPGIAPVVGISDRSRATMPMDNPDRAAATMAIPEWEAWVAAHPDIEIRLPDGNTVRVPAPERWSDAVLEHVEDGKPIAAVRAMLSPEDHAKLAASGANSAYLLHRIEAQAGLTRGESSASSA